MACARFIPSIILSTSKLTTVAFCTGVFIASGLISSISLNIVSARDSNVTFAGVFAVPAL